MLRTTSCSILRATSSRLASDAELAYLVSKAADIGSIRYADDLGASAFDLTAIFVYTFGDCRGFKHSCE